MADYQTAIDLASSEYAVFRALINRGLIFIDQEKYDLAISEYTSVIEKDSEYILAYSIETLLL